MKALTRPLLLGAGWFCVGLGMLGIIMPLFPTTPFLLVALWAFSKSSPELAERIRQNRYAGPYVRAWQDHGVIPAKAKAAALAMMAAMLAYIQFWTDAPNWAVVLAAVALAATALFIISRPSQPLD